MRNCTRMNSLIIFIAVVSVMQGRVTADMVKYGELRARYAVSQMGD